MNHNNKQIQQLSIDAARGDTQAQHYLERVCMAEAATDKFDRSTWKQRAERYTAWGRELQEETK